MKMLDNYYPSITKGMSLWFIPVILVLGIAVLALFLGVEESIPPHAIAIAVVSSLALIGVAAGGFIYQYKSRAAVRRKVIMVNRDFAIRTEAGFTPKILSWAKEFVHSDPMNKIIIAFDLHLVGGFTPGKVPYAFLTLKYPGTVIWEWEGMKKRARGVQKGCWCEVEWYNEHPEKVTKLALHELAHVVLTFSDPLSSEGEQHVLINNARIEAII